MNEQKLLGKTVLITGGAVRVGKYLTLAAADAGADVILHYASSRQEAEQTQREVLERGVQCWTIHQDFARLEEVEGFLDRCRALSPIDVLVNNSAIFKNISMDETTLDEWQTHISINLTAPYLLTRRFIQLGRPDRKGRVINLLDWRALRPGPDHLPYTISKSGLAALTHALAASAAPRVTVNGLALGAMLAPVAGVDEQQLFSNYPIKRWIEPQELTEAFLFLAAGPEVMTGEIVHLDGGRHLI